MSTPATDRLPDAWAPIRPAELALSRSAACVLLSQIRVGRLTVVEGGRRRVFGLGPPMATIEVRSPRFWPMLMRGSRGLAEAYAQGAWESPDLVAVFRLAARNAWLIDRARALAAPVRRPAQLVRALADLEPRRRARREIAAHYDLGNDLFELMLDPTMMYSCALFERPAMTLEEASLAKLERICERLELGPGDRVLEIGTGWGGFAVHAARTRGCRVTTTTISARQYEYARRRVREAGLEDRVTVLERDWRDLRGRWDRLVCIEMIEAVGWERLGGFFARCGRLLTAHGAMLLQAITIDDRAYRAERSSRSFIKTHIFPGGSLPSLEVIARHVARRTDLQTVELQDLTASYVETLRRWRDNFDAASARLSALGYDERFRRMWTLYLAYCEAGFAERRICDVQLLLAKPGWAAVTLRPRSPAARWPERRWPPAPRRTRPYGAGPPRSGAG